jgi:hypothetical protein
MLSALLGASGRLLAEGGFLVCVAQAHVCVGALAEGLCAKARPLPIICGQGRFVVWRVSF